MTNDSDVSGVEEAGRTLCDAAAYADEPRLYEACSLLRAEDPVHRVEVEAFDPFWAITKHEDVFAIERNTSNWLAAPRPALLPGGSDAADIPVRTLLQMDPPEHTLYRQFASAWFRPGRLRQLEQEVRVLARRWVDEMAAFGGACDFVSDVAAHFPLYVILSILGLPEGDYSRMLQLTQELAGQSDPEFSRGEDQNAILLEFFEYFQHLTLARREHPTDDLASAIANAEINGAPIGDVEAAGYYVAIATAGHDTTSATIAGGLKALVEAPQQLQTLRAEPDFMPMAVEEMLRWVSPVKQFMRTAAFDQEVRGVRIPSGDAVLLSFPSANRDEEVFSNPDHFDARREPNRHLAFGFGAHYCLGAQLARLEARVFFSELLPRLKTIELTGEPTYMESIIVGGPKHLPIGYELSE